MTGVRAVAFSPDSTILATGGYDNIVRLWRVPEGTLLRDPGWAHWLGALSRLCARRPDSGLRRLRHDRAPVARS